MSVVACAASSSLLPLHDAVMACAPIAVGVYLTEHFPAAGVAGANEPAPGLLKVTVPPSAGARVIALDNLNSQLVDAPTTIAPG